MTAGVGYFDDRQRVLEATDIVQLVGEHVALRPRGREFVGLCPFHDDHSPSMTVVPAKGIFKCFSCGAGGDAFAFVMNFHKMSFREALEHLAERANITLTARKRHADSGTTTEDDSRRLRQSLLAANQAACDFFQTILRHEEHGLEARALIARRAVSPEMVREFGLGAAPDKWDGLRLTIESKGMAAEPFAAAGLLKRRESGGFYDAFRDRLIFPIHDQIGRVVAFGGRRLKDVKRPDGSEDAKYLNSSESAVFEKGSMLYALHQAAGAIRSTRTAIVVEGYMDAIACHQAGVRNVVATLGTALTPASARLLRRQCETVVLLFDGDEAGSRAAQRAVEIFFAEPIDVRIAVLSSVTDAKDPDELLKREGGAEVFKKAIDAAIDPLSLMFRHVSSELEGRGIAGRARVAEEFMDRLASLGLGRIEPIRKQMIVRRLAEVTSVPAETLFAAAAERASRPKPVYQPTVPGPDLSDITHRRLSLAERLLGCILCDPQLAHTLQDGEAALAGLAPHTETDVDAVARAALETLNAGEAPSLAAVLARLEDLASQRAATHLASEVDRLSLRDQAGVHRLWNEWLIEARRLNLESRLGAEPSVGTGGAAAAESAIGVVQTLERLRRVHEAVGKDRRTIPTPT